MTVLKNRTIQFKLPGWIRGEYP